MGPALRNLNSSHSKAARREIISLARGHSGKAFSSGGAIIHGV